MQYIKYIYIYTIISRLKFKLRFSVNSLKVINKNHQSLECLKQWLTLILKHKDSLVNL